MRFKSAHSPFSVSFFTLLNLHEAVAEAGLQFKTGGKESVSMCKYSSNTHSLDAWSLSTHFYSNMY